MCKTRCQKNCGIAVAAKYKLGPKSRDYDDEYGITILLGALLLAQNAPPPPPPMTVDKVANDFYVVRGEGGNTSVYVTDESLIVVDPKFERNHDELVAKIGALSNKPVRYVINTHAHGDHTGGNLQMAPAVIIGHRNAAASMVKGKLPGPPQLTYSDEIQVSSGGKEIIGYHYGRCHTDGDTFVYFPALKVLSTGDCITTGNGQGVPNPPGSSRINIDYNNGGSLVEAVKTIGEVLNWTSTPSFPATALLSRKPISRGGTAVSSVCTTGCRRSFAKARAGKTFRTCWSRNSDGILREARYATSWTA